MQRDKSFKLILEGPVKKQPLFLETLQHALQQEFSFSTDEVTRVLEATPYTLMANQPREALVHHFEVLRKAGGKVQIVREGTTPPLKPTRSIESSFSEFYNEYITKLQNSLEQIDTDDVCFLARAMIAAREQGRQILIMGNGGSAATASHMVNDFAKNRFGSRCKPFRVIGLSDNVSWMTASANDEGYDSIFVNQLTNLLQPHDLVIAISSSGNSPNIIKAVEYANAHGARTCGIVGFGGGRLKEIAHHSIDIPTAKGEYGVMEDASLAINHILSLFIVELDRQSLKEVQ